MTSALEHGQQLDRLQSADAILLADPDLMQRIDEVHSGNFERENHPDRCPSCGNIEPGFLCCRRCGHVMKRRGKAACFCFQEVDGTAQHQDALERVVSTAKREEDGGAYEWVTAILAIVPRTDSNGVAVLVTASNELPPSLVGYVPPKDAPQISKALKKIRAAYTESIACKALVQGGVLRRDGSRTSYGIRLLLPSPGDMPKAFRDALGNRR